MVGADLIGDFIRMMTCVTSLIVLVGRILVFPRKVAIDQAEIAFIAYVDSFPWEF